MKKHLITKENLVKSFEIAESVLSLLFNYYDNEITRSELESKLLSIKGINKRQKEVIKFSISRDYCLSLHGSSSLFISFNPKEITHDESDNFELENDASEYLTNYKYPERYYRKL